MLRVDLARLGREQTLQVEGWIEPSEHFFEGCPFELEKPLRVVLTAGWAGTGEVIVRGHVTGTILQTCRRCLEPVQWPVDTVVTLVFVPSDLLEDDDGEAKRLEPNAMQIDLDPHLREEVIVAVPRYVECRPDCRGICAGCGANLNADECQCSEEETDPRWDALRALKNE